jgi:hypothetical protein
VKYSAAQLEGMAKQVLEAKAKGDARYELLVLQLSLRTGMSAQRCEERIAGLAKMG